MRLAVVCTIGYLLIGWTLSAQESQPAEYKEVEALLAASVEAGSDSAFAILQRALDLSRSSGYQMGEAKALTYTGIEKEEIADYVCASGLPKGRYGDVFRYTTILIILPGTTITFFGAFPSSHFCTAGLSSTSLVSDSWVASAGKAMVALVLPLMAMG